MGERYPFPYAPSLPPLPFPPSPAVKRLPEKQLGVWGSVSFPCGVRCEPRPHTHFGYFELENRTRRHFCTNANTAVMARSAGTTFKNLHQQKFPGRIYNFRWGISPRLYVWKKHCWRRIIYEAANPQSEDGAKGRARARPSIRYSSFRLVILFLSFSS